MLLRPSTSVLVIDDNTALTENLAEILEELGAEVHRADSAEVALAQFDERNWSLVVTDVRMPGIDGIELLALLKERSPGTPVLVMTGYADRQTIARAHESGALAVVDKPLDIDAFLQLVTRVTGAEKRVLVLDDDLALIGNLTEVLSEIDGVLAHPATTISLARKLATAIDFEVAVIDLHLPDGNGLVVAQDLLGPEHDCAIIIITGHPEQLTEVATHERVVVLTKPVTMTRLLECVREAK
jgi:DNA-binding NtrC family response regulator